MRLTRLARRRVSAVRPSWIASSSAYAGLVNLYRGTREEPEREQVSPDEYDAVLKPRET